MPTDKDFKRLIRERMAATGERYTVARAALTPTATATTRPLAERARAWIELLSHPEHNMRAFDQLKALPPDELQPLAIAGSRHTDAKIRRRSCRLLDDLALTRDTLAALEACMDDPDPLVRGAALHSLSCERCKPDGFCLDPRPLTERAAADPSAKVRRGVVMTLAWNPAHSDDWALGLATRFLDDYSSEIRRYARLAVDRIEGQRRSDAERRQLPEPLRTKTERHPSKWVAIDGGRIVAVDPPPSWRRRHPNAQLYFVST
jgi:hypothetical protein